MGSRALPVLGKPVGPCRVFSINIDAAQCWVWRSPNPRKGLQQGGPGGPRGAQWRAGEAQQGSALGRWSGSSRRAAPALRLHPKTWGGGRRREPGSLSDVS